MKENKDIEEIAEERLSKVDENTRFVSHEEIFNKPGILDEVDFSKELEIDNIARKRIEQYVDMLFKGED